MADQSAEQDAVVRAACRAVDGLSERAERRIREEGAYWVRLDRTSALALIESVDALRTPPGQRGG